MRLLPNWCLKNSTVGPAPSDVCVEEVGVGEEMGTFQGSIPPGPPPSRLERTLTCGGRVRWSQSTRTHVTNAAATVVGVGVVVGVAYVSRSYVRGVLLWVAQQPPWVVVLVFLALFSLVSLPFMWGYIVVNVAAGYMFGTWRGLGVTVSTATVGVLLAHLLIRLCLREVVHRRVVTSRLLRALLAVLGGSQAFRVVAVTRLTPIPFGLQNAVFAVSGVPTWLYLAATVLGLLPTQLLNCYLGTTVRSLDDLVTHSSTASTTSSTSATATGWGVFAVQILISIGLTAWVVRRAKAELHKTMAAHVSDAEAALSDSTTSTPASPAHAFHALYPAGLSPVHAATHHAHVVGDRVGDPG